MVELIYGGTGVWFMIGALLVFFMQCGFAMVETGFTRAKNAGNIIMKNLMDFCIGTVVFSLLGFGLMMSEDYVAGFIGVPNLNMFTDWMNFDWNSFVFSLYSVLQQLLSFQVLWQSVQNSRHTVFTAQLFHSLFTRLKQVGFGTVRVGLHSSAVSTLRVQS